MAPVAADYYVLNSSERQKSAARQQIKGDASTRFRFSLDSQQQSLLSPPQTTRFQSDFSSFATPIENLSITPRPPTPDPALFAEGPGRGLGLVASRVDAGARLFFQHGVLSSLPTCFQL